MSMREHVLSRDLRIRHVLDINRELMDFVISEVEWNGRLHAMRLMQFRWPSINYDLQLVDCMRKYQVIERNSIPL